MTQDMNDGSENLNWMEISETDAVNGMRHSGQRLPFIAAAVSLLIIGGGAVFAQTTNEAPAQAEEVSATQSPVAITPSVSAPEVPVITNIAPKVSGYYDDEDDDEDDDDHYGEYHEEEDDDEEDDD